MEQDHVVRDREQVVASVTVHQPQAHIMEDRLFMVLVVEVFHAEADVDLLLAVDADAGGGIGMPILLPQRIILLPHLFKSHQSKRSFGLRSSRKCCKTN
jgi:hypothetical protein